MRSGVDNSDSFGYMVRGHGKYEIVPNLHGLSYAQAEKALKAAGLQVELSDSVYDKSTAPGTVLEQSPRAKTKVKPNRVVYLTVNGIFS